MATPADFPALVDQLGTELAAALQRVAQKIADLTAGQVTQAQIDSISGDITTLQNVLVASPVVPGVTAATFKAKK